MNKHHQFALSFTFLAAVMLGGCVGEGTDDDSESLGIQDGSESSMTFVEREADVSAANVATSTNEPVDTTDDIHYTVQAAAAGVCGVGGSIFEWDYGQIGKNAQGQGYPVVLHGVTVRLYSGLTNAKTYAKATINPGDILSIDRSIGATVKKWPTTSDVQQALGGWDYCETRNTGSGTATVKTVTVDGYLHAVRPCLRRNGALQCANIWYADQDS